MSEEIGWAPVATAPDQVTAEMWAELLRNDGVPAMVDGPHGIVLYRTVVMPCTVMVPEPQLEDARRILGPAIVGRRYRRRK